MHFWTTDSSAHTHASANSAILTTSWKRSLFKFSAYYISAAVIEAAKRTMSASKRKYVMKTRMCVFVCAMVHIKRLSREKVKKKQNRSEIKPTAWRFENAKKTKNYALGFDALKENLNQAAVGGTTESWCGVGWWIASGFAVWKCTKFESVICPETSAQLALCLSS